MISLRTNISSLITQQNMGVSTNRLNTAIERMSTGYKINHASDNAANYSISTNMNTQLSACDVAADNIAMGMDLLTVAQDTIAGMQDRGSRIHALITQARNGTYGATSLAAMTQEAQAIAAEIYRLYQNTQYNGINLLNGFNLPDWAQNLQSELEEANSIQHETAKAPDNNLPKIPDGFVNENIVSITPEIIVHNEVELKEALQNHSTIGIAGVAGLISLCKLINNKGETFDGKNIVLTEDIDLSSVYWDEYKIGNEEHAFKGTFDGQGHTIKGLHFSGHVDSNVGLFGVSEGEIINLKVEGSAAGVSKVGLICGFNRGGVIYNCQAKGSVRVIDANCGLITGINDGEIKYCKAEGNVKGNENVGGITGINNSNIGVTFFSGNVKGTKGGGITGVLAGGIRDSYAQGSVNGENRLGGAVGLYSDGEMSNVVSNCVVNGTNYVGSLIGFCVHLPETINNCKSLYQEMNMIGGNEYLDEISWFEATTQLFTKGSSWIINAHAPGQNGLINGFVEVAPEVILDSAMSKDLMLKCMDKFDKIGVKDAASLEILGNNGFGNGDKTIVLASDIDASGLSGSFNLKRCSFVGNGHSIYNLSAPLFNSAHESSIQNLHVSGEAALAGDVGLLANMVEDSNIINCSSSGRVKSDYVSGGLIGTARDTIIDSCSSSCEVAGTKAIGGLIGGAYHTAINNSYATGSVSGKDIVGGLVGEAVDLTINRSHASGNVSGIDRVGGIAGTINHVKIINSYTTGNVTAVQDDNYKGISGGIVGEISNGGDIAGCYSTGDVVGNGYAGGILGVADAITIMESYSMGNISAQKIAAGIAARGEGTIDRCFATGNISGSESYGVADDQCFKLIDSEYFKRNTITIQAGINSQSDSRIKIDTNLNFNGFDVSDLTNDTIYESVKNFLNQLSQKSVEIGAAQNRLESALESNLVKMDNLTSSLSTIRDADISEVSSEFIRQQILQQAAATLMSTANQSPSIALQLL